jgi:tetratricopeptide (TPR) repeat protein
MATRNSNATSPLGELFFQVAREMYKNPAPAQFGQWFIKNAPLIFPPLLMTPGGEAANTRMLRALGAAIYNAMPQPAYSLQPHPVPKPGRNDSCSCGSGNKYKHCCGQAGIPLPLDNVNMLRFMLDVYPKKQLASVAQSRANLDAVADTAHQWLHEGWPDKVVALLEPYFDGSGVLSDRLELLFDSLMNALFELGKDKRRMQLLDTVEKHGDKLLKATAYQRHATICTDQSDFAAAWRYFKLATSLQPNDPSLSFLEVSILTSEGRHDEAKVRALWWAEFLTRLRDPSLQQLVAMLRDMAKDPLATLLAKGAESDPHLDRLVRAFRAAPAPQCNYEFDDFPVPTPTGGSAQVMGPLKAQPKLAKLEQNWQRTFAQSKPPMTAVQNDAPEVWDNADEWLNLLEKNPLLWQSFEVLDDLVMAVEVMPWLGVVERLMVPLAERVAELLRLHIEAFGMPLQCHWVVHENRRVLRPIAHLAFVCLEARNWARFMELAQWLVLELNPNDNHGLRDQLSHAYLELERFEDVIRLQARYPDDGSPTIQLNFVLALYCLGRLQDAARCLIEAQKNTPQALKSLLATTPKPVKPDEPYGVVMGGKYEAWLYVKDHLAYWQKYAALDWARNQLTGAAGKRKSTPPNQPTMP